MVAATAVPSQGRRRGPATVELLACAGIAAAGLWPGNPSTPTRMAVMTACLLPLALRTLLRLEEGLAVPASDILPGRQEALDYHGVFQHSRAALALVEVMPGGRSALRHANPVFSEICARVHGRPIDTPGDLFTRDGASLLDTLLVELASGARSHWEGRLDLTGGAGPRGDAPGMPTCSARALTVGLAALPAQAAGRSVLISMNLTPATQRAVDRVVDTVDGSVADPVEEAVVKRPGAAGPPDPVQATTG